MISFLRDNIDLLLKVLPLIFGVLGGVRIIIDYSYAKKMQDYFNIPYKYFIFDWKKSLVETLFYAILLVVIVFTNCFCILYRNEYTNVPIIFILFIFMNSIYMLATIYGNTFLNDLKKVKKRTIISLIVSFVFALFLVLRVYEIAFKFIFAIYFLLSVSFFIYGIVGYFRLQMNPEKRYEIYTIDNQKYAIVGKSNDDYVVIKISDDYIFNSNDPFKIISNICDCDISYHAIKKL